MVSITNHTTHRNLCGTHQLGGTVRGNPSGGFKDLM
jgi:hypothetical protein